jgi:hypothetical protein
MTEGQISPLITDAYAILLENDRGEHTVPHNELFPHQWLWDSCFIAIGMSNYDPNRAAQELESLMRGQWSNHMVAQCIFSDGWRHEIERRNWGSKHNQLAPPGISTSGITQPPVIAEAVWQVGQKLETGKRTNFYESMVPRLVNYHDYLMTERNINSEGLVTLIHPYESGMDNSPPWEEAVRHNYRALYKIIGTPIIGSVLNKGVGIVRRDTKNVSEGQRMQHADALAYHALVGRLRRTNYDMSRIVADQKIVLIEDICFNSVLARGNMVLGNLAEQIDYDLPLDWHQKADKHQKSLGKLWDQETGYYYSRDARTKELIKIPTVASLMPLYAGTIPRSKADRLIDHIQDQTKFATPYPLPSVPLDNEHLDLERYWRGPSWHWINWMIAAGLRNYQRHDLADSIELKTLEAATQHGIAEHIHTITGKPLGISRFSPAAAIIIDFAHQSALRNAA